MAPERSWRVPDVVERLGQVRLFAGLSQENVEALATIVRRHKVARGATIVRQGETGKTMFIVDSGEIVALAVDERGQDTPPRFLPEGEYWGETSLLIGEPRDATMRVRVDAELLYIQKSDFDQLLAERPGIWSELDIRPDVQIKLEAPQFGWLGDDEHVGWFGQKHWIVLARNITVTVLFLLVVLMAAMILARVLPSWAGVALPLIAIALAAPWLIWNWIDWRNDFHVITSRRVVHVEKILLQYESRTEAPLDKVQNTNTDQSTLGNLLDFAQMRIVTAGAAMGYVDFDWVTQPDLVQLMLVEQIRRYRLQERTRERSDIVRMLDEQLRPPELELPGDGADEGVEDKPEAPLPAPRRRNPLSLLNRGEGCRGFVMDTGIASFLARPHLPRLGVIREGKSIIWRKHWFLLLRDVFAPALLLGGSIIIVLLGLWGPLLALNSVWVTLLGLVFAFVGFVWLTYVYEDWRNDLYVVTETDIIDIERTPFLGRESRRQANLGNIQDTRYEMPGFWANLVGRGNVIIETAGQGEFTFDNVFDPSGVQREITNRQEALRQRRRAADRKEREEELAQWFTIYHQGRQRAQRESPGEGP
jgi:hypothetical protein